ncbi:MAG: S-layer homology domain-containing protein [Selenomonas sp.]|nr:S-layer homology domain-containing protein [Selenomonas sp.]
MKKTLVSTLTTALVVGAASTTFAAANPFADVPADHWAYDAVSQLAADGVIDGYGDSTFKGNRNITRYEMAQMVAKAMAKNTSGADKALVDKLAAEFAEELNNLGVRVANLERNADMVKWNGKIEYTAVRANVEKLGEDLDGKNTQNNLKFRLEPSAEVNEHWHVNARLDADVNAKEDAGDDGKVSMKRIWAQGDYKNFQVKAGKFASMNSDSFADTEFSGAEVSFGKSVKGILGVGRLKLSNTAAANAHGVAQDADHDWADGYYVGRGKTGKDRTAGYQYVGVEGKASKLSGGLYYHHLSSESFKTAKYTKNADTDNFNLIAAKAAYRFDKNVAVNGFYANNRNADYFNNAASIEVDYKGAERENRGTWGAWLAYRHLGAWGMVANTYDVIQPNEKGWEIGANYTFVKNVVGTLRYGDIKMLDDNGDGLHRKGKRLFGRLEFFF